MLLRICSLALLLLIESHFTVLAAQRGEIVVSRKVPVINNELTLRLQPPKNAQLPDTATLNISSCWPIDPPANVNVSKCRRSTGEFHSPGNRILQGSCRLRSRQQCRTYRNSTPAIVRISSCLCAVSDRFSLPDECCAIKDRHEILILLDLRN